PQLVRQSRVIAPARLDHHSARRGAHHEPLIRVVRLQLGVEADPNLRAGLTDGRNHRAPALLADVLGLFDPQDIRTLQRLDVMHALVAKTVEGKARAVAPDDLGLLDLVMPLEPEALYLVLQELMHAIPNGLHRLA